MNTLYLFFCRYGQIVAEVFAIVVFGLLIGWSIWVIAAVIAGWIGLAVILTVWEMKKRKEKE